MDGGLVEKFDRIVDAALSVVDGDSLVGTISYDAETGPLIDVEMEIDGVPYSVAVRPSVAV